MKEIEVGVIGGGINGLMTAYRLLERGFRSVVLFEANVLGSGQSSRNAGGIRAQFGNEETVRLMAQSIKLWNRLPSELEYNLLFSQDGYLFACYDDEDQGIYSKAREMQNRNGIRTRWLSPSEVVEMAPGINSDSLAGANFHMLDGTLHHDAVIAALMFAVRRMGGLVLEHTPVTSISRGKGVLVLRTAQGDFEAQHAVNATAARVNELSSCLGLSFPVRPARRQLIATEPLRSMIKPMLVSLKYGITIHQSLRGEFVGHTHPYGEPEGFDSRASLSFMVHFARDIIRLLPFMKYVKIVRQWAGTYDITPDSSPVLGPADEEGNYVVIAGSSGHGFMLSPAIGLHIAEYVATGRVDEMIRPFLPGRFKEGRMLGEILLSNSTVL